MKNEGLLKRNNSIDIFRFICAIMVIAIHTHPFIDFHPILGYTATQVISNIAVPFFFSVSGFFYIKKIEGVKKDKKKIKEIFNITLKKYFQIYCFWSLVYFILDWKSYFYVGASIKSITVSFVLNFFVFGSYYHFWYFIGIFFSMFIVTIAYIIQKEKKLAYLTFILYALGLLGCSYYAIGNQLPVISIFINSQCFTLIRRIILMALPFYMQGYFILRKMQKQVKICNLFYLLISYILEITMINILNIGVNVIITVSLYKLVQFLILFLLKNPMSEKENLGHKYRYLSNFIYFSHPIYISILSKIGLCDGTSLFLFTAILSITIGSLLIYINKPFINKQII